MKKLISAWLFICMASATTLAAEDINQQVLQQLEALQRQVLEQQRQIEMLKEQITASDNTVNETLRAELRQELDAAIEAKGLAQQKDSGPLLTLGKGIDGLRLTGDLRVRYELRELDKMPNYVAGWDGLGTQDQKNERWRTRFRLGGVWTNQAENWEIGAGLATGEDNHTSGASSATSTNDTWGQGGAFETGNIYLDYAYAKHKMGDATITIGQHKYPFLTTGIMVDGDIRPTGATLGYKYEGFFGTLGAYNVRYSGNNETLANMYGGQVGYGFKSDKLNGKLAIGYFHYDDQVTEAYLPKVVALDYSPKNDYNWQIGDIYGELGGKIGEVGIKGYAQVSKNFGADSKVTQANFNRSVGYDSEDETCAWIAGMDLSFRGFKLGYAYTRIEGDSLPWFIKDADFGSGFGRGTNVQGHIIKASYDITKNFSVGATALLYDLVESNAAASSMGGNLYQFDLGYKF